MSDLSHVQASNRWVDILHPATRKKIGLKVCLRPKYSKEVQSQLRKNRKAGS